MTEALEAQVRQEDHPKQLQLRALDVFMLMFVMYYFLFFFRLRRASGNWGIAN